MIESTLFPIVSKINEYLSSYILIFLLVGVGLWYSIRTRFVQVRCFGEGMKKFFGELNLRGGAQKRKAASRKAYFSGYPHRGKRRAYHHRAVARGGNIAPGARRQSGCHNIPLA